jgi:hypothetical protein
MIIFWGREQLWKEGGMNREEGELRSYADRSGHLHIGPSPYGSMCSDHCRGKLIVEELCLRKRRWSYAEEFKDTIDEV